MITLFSSFFAFLKNIENLKLKKQKKETKKELKKEESKSNEDIITAKEKAKKSKKVIESKEKEKQSKIRILILTVFEWICTIIEQFIAWLISLIGIYGFFIILVVIVLMIAIYGLLHIDLTVIDSLLNRNEECVSSTSTYTEQSFSLEQIISRWSAFNSENKKAAQILTMYSEILNKDMSTVLPENKSKYIEEVKSKIGVKDVIYFLFGFGSIENVGGIKSVPANSDDLFKSPSTQNSEYAFLGLHKNNVFDGFYDFDGLNQGSGSSIPVLNTSFVSSIKSKYTPEDTPLFENNYMPYGVSTQVGAFSSNYLVNQYDFVTNNIDSIMKEYGIEENKDSLTSYIHLFVGSAAYHSGGGATLTDENIKGLLSLWCALWSTTSETDNKRNFDNIEVILSGYNFTEDQLRPYIYGDTNLMISWDDDKKDCFKINGKKVDKILWKWVWENCSNPSYFESTAKVWLDKFQGGSGDSPMFDSSYGLCAYIIGRDLVADIGSSAPVANGGSSNNCDCVENNSGGSSGSLSLSGIKKSAINGDWPEDVQEKMLSYGWTEYFGRSYSLEHPDENFPGGDTFESWRTDTKWKVPYQIQYNNNEIGSGSGVYAGLSAGSSGSGCAIYMSSHIASALTGDFISFYEMFAALRANGDVDGSGSFQNQYANSTFEQLGIYWSGLLSNNTFVDGGSSKENCSVVYPEGSTMQERVNKVLDAGGIVGIRLYGGGIYTNDKHYFVISERNGDKYKTVSFSHPAEDNDWQTWEHIVGSNGVNLPPASEGRPAFYFAYKDGAGGSAGVTGTPVFEVEVPSDLKQSGLIGDYTNYVYFGDVEGWGWKQGEVWDLWVSKGRGYDESKDISTIDGLYLVAVRNKFGNAGDAISIVLEDGTVINAVIGDIKGSDAQDDWGHVYSTGVSLIEWEAYGTAAGNKAGVDINLGDWKEKKVSKIINYGSYLEDQSILTSNSTVSKSSSEKCISKGGPSIHADNATSNISELPGGVVKPHSYGSSAGKGSTYLTQEPDAPVWNPAYGENVYEYKESVAMYDKTTGYRLGLWPTDYNLDSIVPTKDYHGLIWPCSSTMQGVGYEHHGADFHAKCYTPIYAAGDGTLRYSEWGHHGANQNYWETAYAITLTLDNPVSYNGKTIKDLWYGHMVGIRFRVPDNGSVNIKVKKGDLIGWMGFANAVHLHLTLDYDCNIYTDSLGKFFSIGYNEYREVGK